MSKIRNKRTAVIITIGVHCCLLILFIFIGLNYPDPPPPEEGITITFGQDVSGQTIKAPKPVEPIKPKQTPVKTTKTVEAVVTQEQDAPITVKKKKENKKISNKLSSALDALNKQRKKNNTTTSKGNSNKNGNQGSRNGDKRSKAFKGGGQGNGVKFSLDGRYLASFKKPDNNTQESGIVVVDIVVNSEGKVVSASPGARGSTTSSKELYKKAQEAAYKARFNASSENRLQKGKITFVFILN